MKKKIAAAAAVVLAAAVLFTAAGKTVMSPERQFKKQAAEYLEQKYNIKIDQCTYYRDARVEYQSAWLDGGYFYSTPQFGVFADEAGGEILCVNRNGVFSDDRELDEIYSRMNEYFSKVFGAEVGFVRFTSESEEYIAGNSVDRNIGIFLEKNMDRYTQNDTETMINDLFDYLKPFRMEVYAKLDPDTIQREQKMAVQEYQYNNGIDELSLYIYNTDIGANRMDPRTTGTIDDGDLYCEWLESDKLYTYLYRIFSEDGRARIIGNEKNERNTYNDNYSDAGTAVYMGDGTEQAP